MCGENEICGRHGQILLKNCGSTVGFARNLGNSQHNLILKYEPSSRKFTFNFFQYKKKYKLKNEVFRTWSTITLEII